MTAPTPVSDPSQQKLPGLAGIWVGVACIVLGVAVGIVLFVTGVVTLVGGVEDMQRVSVATGGTVEIDDPGMVSVYAERTIVGSTSFGFQPQLDVRVTRPDGEVVGLSPSSLDQSYTWDDKEGFLLGRFDANQAGTYEIQAAAGDNAGSYGTLAVGDPFDESGLAGILGGLGVGGLLVLVGIVLVIVFAVRRSRARRARDAAWMAAQGGGGWGGGYGGGYGVPGAYPQAGYPQTYGAPPPTAPGWGQASPSANPPGWAPPPTTPPPVPEPPASGGGTSWSPPPSSTETPDSSPDGPTEPIP